MRKTIQRGRERMCEDLHKAERTSESGRGLKQQRQKKEKRIQSKKGRNEAGRSEKALQAVKG